MAAFACPRLAPRKARSSSSACWLTSSRTRSSRAWYRAASPRGCTKGLAQHFEGDDAAAARRRLKAVGVVVPLRYLEGNFSRFTADQAMVAYDQSLVIVDMLIQRGTVDWNALFRALSDSSRTEYTFDNSG